MSQLNMYGIHPVEELLQHSPGRVREVVVAGRLSDHQFQTIKQRVDELDVAVRQTSADELDRMAEGGNHQRIAASVTSYPYRTLDDALEIADESDGFGCIMALAQIQDPGNLGAILRSAGAMDVDAVIIPKHRAAQMTPAVIRASSGVALRVPVVQVTNLSRALRTLKEEGYWVVGTFADDADPLWSMDWELNAAVVMGSEHKGIRPGIEKECDFRVEIPLGSDVESLNVAAASAVTLYDRLRTLADS